MIKKMFLNNKSRINYKVVSEYKIEKKEEKKKLQQE